MRSMRKIVSRLHAGLSALTLVAVIAQFYLAGVGAFGAASYQAHRITGDLIALASLLLLLLALAGWVGRARVALSAVLVGLMVLQMALPNVSLRWVAAAHVLNALAILGVVAQLFRASAMSGRRGDRTPVVAEPIEARGR